MARLHQNAFATNLTSNQTAGVTTTPLNSIPSIAAPFYLAFDATNLNGKYEVVDVTSKTATHVNHAATTYAHTTAEEVRMVVPAVELDSFTGYSSGTTASDATPDPVGGVKFYNFTVTALATAITTFNNPTATPADGDRMVIRIKDDGTARAISWGTLYRAGTDVTLPTTTVLSKTLYCAFMYNSADTKWDLLAVVDNI